MHALTIVLLCHNRPQLARRAIVSMLGQTNRCFNFIISDNSSNWETKDLAQREFPEVEYVSLYPGIPIFDHFRKAISRIQSRFFVLFHDDDVLHPDYVENVLAAVRGNDHIAAVATNCRWIDIEGRITSANTGFSTKQDVVLEKPRDLLIRYLRGAEAGGVAPWCSYAYVTAKIQGLFPDFQKGRNYCDTTFLLEVLSKGPILWLKEPLVHVFLHSENISRGSGARDYKAFVTFVRKHYQSDVEKYEIEQYRCLRLLWTLKLRHKFPPYSAMKYLFRWIPILVLHSSFVRRSLVSWVIRVLRFGWR